MRTVDHAPRYRRLLVEIRLFLGVAGVLGHVLEIQKAAEGVRVSLGLHHLERELVVLSVTVDRAGPDHELLLLVRLHELLVLQLHHDLSLVVEHLLTRSVLVGGVWGCVLVLSCFLWGLDGLLLLVDELRLNFKILLGFHVCF